MRFSGVFYWACPMVRGSGDLVRLTSKDWLKAIGFIAAQTIILISIAWAYTTSIESRLSKVETHLEHVREDLQSVKQKNASIQ